MATRSSSRNRRTNRDDGNNRRNSRSSSRSSSRRNDYQEQEGWGTAFQRPDNEGAQPQFTGTGLLSRETLEEILDAGGEYQIAIWTRDRDGKQLKNRNGTLRFRVHIEPPWNQDDDGDDDDEPDPPERDDDDIPF